MSTDKTPLEDGRNNRGQFTKGNTASQGRKTGSRNKASLLAQQLFEDQAQAVVMSVVDRALQGDMMAAKLIIERLLPPCKERALPPIELGDDPKASIRRLLEDGAITPSELESLCKVAGVKNLDDDPFKIV